MIYYGCPKCQAPMGSPESMAGTTETCPTCGNVTVVPSVAAPPPATRQPSPPPPPPRAGPPPKGSRCTSAPMVCPNPSCGYVGPAIIRRRSSDLAIYALLLLGIIPGLVAYLLRGPDQFLCQACETQVGTGRDTGQRPNPWSAEIRLSICLGLIMLIVVAFVLIGLSMR